MTPKTYTITVEYSDTPCDVQALWPLMELCIAEQLARRAAQSPAHQDASHAPAKVRQKPLPRVGGPGSGRVRPAGKKKTAMRKSAMTAT